MFFSILILWNFRNEESGYFQIHQFFAPLLVFTIPIFDTSTVFIHRLLRGQSPFVGGKDHLSHHLCYNGLNTTKTVLFLFIASIIFGVIGYYIISFNPNFVIPIMIVWGLLFIGVQIIYQKGKRNNPTFQDSDTE